MIKVFRCYSRKRIIYNIDFFQVSTLDAAMSGSLSGAEGFTTQEDQEVINRVEKQLKRRFAIGSQVKNCVH